MYKFYLPNFYQQPFKDLNIAFIDLLQEYPEYFYDNIEIGALYGNFSGVIWNGGRIMAGEAKFSEIIHTIEEINSRNIPLRFTHTNSLIQEKHLTDFYANMITQLAHNGKNEILVNSPILESYLRKTYPNYKYISSTTKCLLNKEDIIQEGEKYYLTVLDYRYNKDLKFLGSLNPKKYELLINPYCGIECPQRQEHYNIISELQLQNIGEDTTPNGCAYIQGFFNALQHSQNLINNEDLYNLYGLMGFEHFKIEGRCNNIIDVIESYLYYMVKPEYQNLIRYSVLKYCSRSFLL